MKIFNRIVIILLLAGLFLLGVFTVLYSFDIADYDLADLPATLELDDLYGELIDSVENLENGSPDALDVATLILIALLGLVLLVFELKPPSPRRVRMQRGTYTTRRAVENEVIEAVEQNPEVLQSKVKVKAQRRPGAKVDVRASVRPDEDVRSIQSEVRDRVQRHLDQRGIPGGNIKVRIIESDPRETRTRVK